MHGTGVGLLLRTGSVAALGACAILAFGTDGAMAQNTTACGTAALRGGISVILSSTPRPSCATAAAMTRDFFAGRTRRFGGPSNAETYFTLDRFSGWRCGTGAGGGGCIRGLRQINWEVVPTPNAVPAVLNGIRPVVRPRTWVPDRNPRAGLGVRFTGLRWSGWGGSGALARGTARVCAGGRCSIHPVSLRVSRLTADRDSNRIVYACLRFVSASGLPELDGSVTQIAGGDDLSPRC